MVLRALIVAGAVSIGALFLAKKGKKDGKAGRGGRASRASGKRCDPLGAFVDLTPVPPTPAKADGKPRPRPLEGMKFAVKDIFDIEGRITGFGSPAWAATHDRAAVTARAVAQCADAGAAGVGVTHMDEFAYSINGENAHYGTPVNPAARGRIPGGSSSGSAVAVAASLRGVDFALGTDSGGSVRVPASLTGCYGFRPTHGAVSTSGVTPFAPSMDTVGWFARDPAVLRKVGRVLLDGKSRKVEPALPESLLVVTDALDLCDVDASCGVATACMALAEQFPGAITRINLGEHLLMMCPSLRAVEDNAKGLDVLRTCFRLLMGAEVWGEIGEWYRANHPETGPGVKERVKAASEVPSESLRVVKAAREEVRVALGILLDGTGAALAFPTTPGAAPETNADAETNERWRAHTLQLTCLCSLIGFPQVTIPMTYPGGDGPIGLSFVMGPYRDNACLAVAEKWGKKIAEAFPHVVQMERTRPKSAAEENGGLGAGAPSAAAAAETNDGEEAKAKGNAAFKEGNFGEAARLYTEALEKGGSRAPKKWRAIVLSNRAMTRLKLGAYAEAEEDCTEALKLDPKNVKARLRRGAARSVSGNYLESLEDYEAALRLEPKNKDAKSEILRMKNILGEATQTPDFDQ